MTRDDLERKKIMKKTLTCIAAFTPIVGVVLGFVLMIIGMFLTETPSESMGLVLSIAAFVMVLIGVIMCWVDIIWFIILAVKNPQLESTMKLVWGILLYMFNIFVFPVYWFMYIRKE